MQRNNRVNSRHSHNLCPNCFSRLEIDKVGNVKCSGDRLDKWQEEVTKYLALKGAEAQLFLAQLSNPSGFLSLIDISTGKAVCGFDSKITPVISTSEQRIPDPLAVSRLERNFKRKLTEEELEEGYEFIVDNKLYKLPFILFPDDV